MGQRLRLSLGAASADVSLERVSGDAPEATPDAWSEDDDQAQEAAIAVDPLVERAVDSALDKALRSPRATTKRSARRYGVILEDGTRVDLTEALEQIDRDHALDGGMIQATVPDSAIPRIKVRDAHYVIPAEEGATVFLAYLWRGLNASSTAALLRRTKRTHQALDALTARRIDGQAVLVLLELVWEAAVRPVPPRAWLPTADVSDAGAARVTEAMRAIRQPATVFDELVDTRSAARAELLEAVRAGRLPRPVAAPRPVEVEALASAGQVA